MTTVETLGSATRISSFFEKPIRKTETISLANLAGIVAEHYRDSAQCAPGCEHVADVNRAARNIMDALTADMNDAAKAAWWLVMNYAVQWR